MNNKRVVSKYKQTRSLNTKKQILDAAEEYFCNNGYYMSSVKDIAASANVSVGSFYFYFKDKDELLLEVYKIQNNRFIETIENNLNNIDEYEMDKRRWLRKFIDLLFKTYGNSSRLRTEFGVLSYNNKEIDKCRKDIKNQAIAVIIQSIEQSAMIKDLKVKDLKSAFMLVIGIIDTTYDRIAQEMTNEDKKKIISECEDLLYKYFFKV